MQRVGTMLFGYALQCTRAVLTRGLVDHMLSEIEGAR